MAEAGDDIDLILSDINKDQIQAGQVLAEPYSINAITKFEADIYVFTEEEGGINSSFNKYCYIWFNFYSAEFYGNVTFLNADIINPGESTSISVKLDKSVAMEVGTSFKIRDGGRTIATGKVTKTIK